MNMVKEYVGMGLRTTLESSFHEGKALSTELLPFVSSPYQRVLESEQYTELLKQQQDLALYLGSYFLEIFGESDDFNHLVSQLSKELQIKTHHVTLTEQVEAADVLSTDLLMESNLDQDVELEIEPDIDQAVYANESINQLTETDETAEITLPTLTPIESVMLAEHTGRSIDLPEEVKETLDLSPLLERGFGGSFTESLPEFKSKKPVVALNDRLLNRLKAMPAPIDIQHPSQFSEAFSWVQRIADSTYMERWSQQGDDFARALCKLTVNYTRYLLDIPRHLRANGMTGDNSFLKVIDRVATLAQKKQIDVNGLKKNDLAKNERWLNDAQNSYYHVQDLVNKLVEKAERLNGDRQIEKLKKLILNDDEVEVIHQQVMTIMQQTDVTPQDQRLAKLLVNYIDDLEGSELRSLRTSIRSYIEQVEAEENQPDVKEIIFPSFAEKKLVVIGGDRRHDATQYLQSLLPETVDFTWLDVASSNGSNARQSLIKSIGNGGVDALIIIKKFISHSVTEPLKAALKENPQCKSAMAKGYGKAQLKLALELLADQL